MAIYRLSSKSINRSSGRSAIAAAAYRAGVKLTDKANVDILPMPKDRGFWNRTEFAYNVGLTSPNPRADAPAL